MAALISLTVLFANVGVILGQAASGSATPETLGGWLAIVNVGLAGVGLVAFMRGWIVPGYVHDQALARELVKSQENEKLRLHLDEVIEELLEGRRDQRRMVELVDVFLKMTEEEKIRKQGYPYTTAPQDRSPAP